MLVVEAEDGRQQYRFKPRSRKTHKIEGKALNSTSESLKFGYRAIDEGIPILPP